MGSRYLADPAKKTRDHIFAEHDWHDFTAHERAARSERFTYVRNYYPELPATPTTSLNRSPCRPAKHVCCWASATRASIN